MFRYLTPEKLEKAKRLHFESKLRAYKKHLTTRKEKTNGTKSTKTYN